MADGEADDASGTSRNESEGDRETDTSRSDRTGLPWRTALGGLAAGVGYVALSRWRTDGDTSDGGTDSGDTGVSDASSGVDGNDPPAVGSVLAGPIDERPDFGEPGRVYLATDSGGRFLDSGSGWDALDIAAPEGIFETARTTESITARSPVYDVRAWGAVGDGETDDTAAIQRALDAAEEAGGGVVRLPPGEYYTTHSLLYGSHTVLTGPGATLRFEPSDADGTALVSRSFDGSTETRDVVIEELAVESVDPEKGNGIGVAKAQNVTIRGCRTEELHWHLIDVAGAKDVSVRDCYAAGLGTAAYQADNLTEEGGLVVEHPDGSTEDAIPDGTENENVDIENNIAEDCGRGVHLHRSGGHDLTIQENKFRRCTGAGVLGDADTHWHDIIVSNNIVEGDGESRGIDLQGDYTNLSIETNTVRDHERGISVAPGQSGGGRPDVAADGSGDDPGGDAPSSSDPDGDPDTDKRPTVAAGVTIGDNTIARISGTALALAEVSGHVSDNYLHDVGDEDTQPGSDRAMRVDGDRGDTSGGGTSTDNDGTGADDNRDGDADGGTDIGGDDGDRIDADHVGVSIGGCDDITVTDNVLRDVTGTGVLVREGSRDVVVSENNINGFDVGVALRSAGEPIAGVDVKDNRFVGRPPSAWAIAAEGGSGVRIGGNAIAGVGRGAVRCADAEDVHVADNDATGHDADCGYAIRSCADVSLHANTARRFRVPISLEAVSDAQGTLDYMEIEAADAIDEACSGVVLDSSGTSPPGSGAFGVGSRVENTEPAAGGPLGWVCVEAGTPGTWKPYGEIES
jgi:hypothetical protein